MRNTQAIKIPWHVPYLIKNVSPSFPKGSCFGEGLWKVRINRQLWFGACTVFLPWCIDWASPTMGSQFLISHSRDISSQLLLTSRAIKIMQFHTQIYFCPHQVSLFVLTKSVLLLYQRIITKYLWICAKGKIPFQAKRMLFWIFDNILENTCGDWSFFDVARGILLFFLFFSKLFLEVAVSSVSAFPGMSPDGKIWWWEGKGKASLHSSEQGGGFSVSSEVFICLKH